MIEELANRHIDYYLAQVPDPSGHISTNVMAARFREVYDGMGTATSPFTVLPNMERYAPDQLFSHVLACLSTAMIKGFSVVLSRFSQIKMERKKIRDGRKK